MTSRLFFRLLADVLFVFPSLELALEAENTLHAKGFQPVLFSLPMEIGLGCGTGIKLTAAKAESARILLEREQIAIHSIWQGTESGETWQKIWG